MTQHPPADTHICDGPQCQWDACPRLCSSRLACCSSRRWVSTCNVIVQPAHSDLPALVESQPRRLGVYLGCDCWAAAGARPGLEPALLSTAGRLTQAAAVANIAHGNSSILADQVGLKLAGADGYVVTEVRCPAPSETPGIALQGGGCWACLHI